MPELGRFRDELVGFFHPAYPDDAPPLLALAAVDVSRNGRRGIDYETAKAACGIVAGNRWDQGTYFARKKELTGEQQRHTWVTVDRPRDRVLPAGPNYYFVVASPHYRYPVVASFDHWRFPHGQLPPMWARLSTLHSISHVTGTRTSDSNSLIHNHNRPRDLSCFENSELVRVAPFSNKWWLESNQMERYYQRPIANNLDRLCDSIHYACDRNSLRLDPNRGFSRRLELQPFVTLQAILAKCRPDSDDQHPRPPVPYIQSEHLFARFAFVILSKPNYRFFWGDRTYAVHLFSPVKGGPYTAELHSDAIALHRRIFSNARRNQYEGTEEPFPKDYDSSGSEASSESSDEDASPHRGRSGCPSPESIHQEGSSAQSTDQIREIPGLQFSGSVRTVSELSPVTPQPERTILYDNDNDEADIDGSQPRKRCRVI
ncbi:hypothetical protein GGR51DRAFT_503607 [Nemania sp. FL0031]|nr:hypothetical protein GGR51DRAFT_503607 [Nemania sp. FL0031]